MKWLIFLNRKCFLFEKGNALILSKINYNIDFHQINKHLIKTRKVQEERGIATEELSSLIRKFYTMKNMRNIHLHESLPEVFLEEYRNNSMCIKTHNHSRFWSVNVLCDSRLYRCILLFFLFFDEFPDDANAQTNPIHSSQR